MGYDDPPHLVTVGVCLQFFMSPLSTKALPKGPAEQQGNKGQHRLDGHRPPEPTQYISIAPGPPRLEQYVPVITVVRVLPSPPFLACTYSLSYCIRDMATGQKAE
jgi:hypothetical protein